MEQVVQVVGAALILTAFMLAQTQRLPATSIVYLTLNLAGGLTLAVVAALDADIGFLLLESVWAAVSAAGLVRHLRRGRRVAQAAHDGTDE